MKHYIRMPRPNRGCSYSFGMPSGHSSMTVVLLVWIAFIMTKKAGTKTPLMSAMMAYVVHVPLILYSRLYLRYHYPIQVNLLISRMALTWCVGCRWGGVRTPDWRHW